MYFSSGSFLYSPRLVENPPFTSRTTSRSVVLVRDIPCVSLLLTRVILQILEAVEAEDFDRIDELCAAALADAALPRMLRARYNAFIACCLGREPEYYLNNAIKVIEEM